MQNNLQDREIGIETNDLRLRYRSEVIKFQLYSTAILQNNSCIGIVLD
jgi:hypothetical protein